VGARSRSPRAASARPSGQHLLRRSRLAAELVRDALISRDDHLLEIGAGTGRLTRPLAERAGRITAVELDPRFAATLERTFERSGNVRVVRGDVRDVGLPSGSWRVFGNLPFALTTEILRRLLDDPTRGPMRADLLLQYEAARKRASIERTSLLSLSWLPWWELAVTRRIPRLAFDPPPKVDAGLLVVRRRAEPLLAVTDRGEYVAMLRRAFDHGGWPVRRSFRAQMPHRAWKRLSRDRGLAMDALPPDLDVWAWVAVLRTMGDRYAPP
jgi:23S rRNA (adenine-N6)-dimethyltransferase